MSRISTMISPKVGFKSYVDIATCMVVQDDEINTPQQVTPGWHGSEAHPEKVADWSRINRDIDQIDALELEWSTRIEKWQRLYPDGGPPVEHCTSLKDLEISVFFLQHPISAMPLWNVMQNFYALDRFVCCTSEESRSTVMKWELIAPFEYLEASKVEKKWRSCLQNLRKEIKDERNMTELLSRIDGIFFGIGKLEESCVELHRSLKETMRGFKLSDLMLEKIIVAVERRFSMIDKYLNIDENHEEVENIGDTAGDSPLSSMLPSALNHTTC